MTDEIDQLAAEFYDHRLRTSPTWAHMIGEYAYADRFEDVSRAGEDAAAGEARAFAARAGAVDEDGLDDGDTITRSMLVWDATSRAEMLEARTTEFAANPIFGVQTSLGVYLPKLAVPDADVAEAMVGKFASVATYLDDLADRHREGIASGRTPADFAVRQTSAQLDAWLATPIEQDQMLTVQEPPSGVDAARWHERLLAVVQKQVRPAAERYRDVLRDEVAPRARPDERCGLTHLPDGA